MAEEEEEKKEIPNPQGYSITYFPDAWAYTQYIFHETRSEPINSENRKNVRLYQILLWKYLKTRSRENAEKGIHSPIHDL